MYLSLLLILFAVTISNALYIPELLRSDRCSKTFGEKCKKDSECCDGWICAFDEYYTRKCGYDPGP